MRHVLRLEDYKGGSILMRTAICLQPGNGNPGDSIANLGCRGLFHQTIAGGLIYDSWHMAEPVPLDYSLIDLYRYDYGLVLCTPWLWDLCATGVKYGLLRDFLNRVTSTKSFALGAGSSFHLDYDDSGSESFWGERTVNDTKNDWQRFDHVTCRDRLAYAMYVEMLGEDSVTLMPCPSYYVAQVFDIVASRERGDLLVFCDINSDIFWKIRDDQVKKPMDYQDELVAGGIDVLTMIPRDLEAFRLRYGREPTHSVVDPVEIVRTLGLYKKVISARVHACMPSLSLGLDVDIIPLDTRALTATGLGAKPIINSLEKAEQFAEPLPKLAIDEAIQRLRERLAIEM